MTIVFTLITYIQVLQQLKMVNFSRHGYHVSFDANGDPVAFYELINWKRNENGGLEFVKVGHYDDSLSIGQKFTMIKNISWSDGGAQAGINTLIHLITIIVFLLHVKLFVYVCIRCLCPYAATAVHREHARFSRRGNRFAAMTVYHVLKERLAILQVLHILFMIVLKSAKSLF